MHRLKRRSGTRGAGGADQGRDGLPTLHAARAGEGARGVGSRVRGLQPAAAARIRGRVRL